MMSLLSKSAILLSFLARGTLSASPCEVWGNYCHKNANCININNNSSFACVCKDGYDGDGKLVCKDYDECLSGNDNVCPDVGGTCVDHDAPRKYSCQCLAGYVPDTGSLDALHGPTNCIEADMCTTGSHTCAADHGICVSSFADGVASYECSCDAGYILDPSDNSCTPKPLDTSDGEDDQQDACEKYPCNPDNQYCEYDSNPSNHKGRICKCINGYFSPSGAGGECQSTEFCGDSTKHECDVNGYCIQIPGSYRCECNVGWVGSGWSCSDKNECEENPVICGTGYACSNTVGSYECIKLTDPPTVPPVAVLTPTPAPFASGPSYKCPRAGYCNGGSEEVVCGAGASQCTCLVDVSGIPTCGEPGTPGDYCTSNDDCSETEFCMVDTGNCCHAANYCMSKCSNPLPGY